MVLVLPGNEQIRSRCPAAGTHRTLLDPASRGHENVWRGEMRTRTGTSATTHHHFAGEQDKEKIK